MWSKWVHFIFGVLPLLLVSCQSPPPPLPPHDAEFDALATEPMPALPTPSAAVQVPSEPEVQNKLGSLWSEGSGWNNIFSDDLRIAPGQVLMLVPDVTLKDEIRDRFGLLNIVDQERNPLEKKEQKKDKADGLSLPLLAAEVESVVHPQIVRLRVAQTLYSKNYEAHLVLRAKARMQDIDPNGKIAATALFESVLTLDGLKKIEPLIAKPLPPPEPLQPASGPLAEKGALVTDAPALGRSPQSQLQATQVKGRPLKEDSGKSPSSETKGVKTLAGPHASGPSVSPSGSPAKVALLPPKASVKAAPVSDEKKKRQGNEEKKNVKAKV